MRTGLPSNEIELFAKELGTRKPAMIIHGAVTNHWFHNDLTNRSFILLVALTGNTGKNGGGFNHYVGQERLWPEQGFFKLTFPETRKKQRFQNTTLWSYVHSTNKGPHLYNGKPIEWYIQESVKSGWMPLWPKDGKKPGAMVIWRANYLNQAKGNEILESSLWKDLDLIVDINYRMDTTAPYDVRKRGLQDNDSIQRGALLFLPVPTCALPDYHWRSRLPGKAKMEATKSLTTRPASFAGAVSLISDRGQTFQRAARVTSTEQFFVERLTVV